MILDRSKPPPDWILGDRGRWYRKKAWVVGVKTPEDAHAHEDKLAQSRIDDYKARLVEALKLKGMVIAAALIERGEV